MTKDIDDMTPDEIAAEKARLKASIAEKEAALDGKVAKLDQSLDHLAEAIAKKERDGLPDD